MGFTNFTTQLVVFKENVVVDKDKAEDEDAYMFIRRSRVTGWRGVFKEEATRTMLVTNWIWHGLEVASGSSRLECRFYGGTRSKQITQKLVVTQQAPQTHVTKIRYESRKHILARVRA